MLEKIRKNGNAYFDTYYIYDSEKHHYIGILEDHCRRVKSRYFVGWHFNGGIFYPNTHQAGKTKDFDTEADAINYIIKGE